MLKISFFKKDPRSISNCLWLKNHNKSSKPNHFRLTPHFISVPLLIFFKCSHLHVTIVKESVIKIKCDLAWPNQARAIYNNWGGLREPSNLTILTSIMDKIAFMMGQVMLPIPGNFPSGKFQIGHCVLPDMRCVYCWN